MARLTSSDGSQRSHSSGIVSSKHYSNTNSNTGIANGRNNTIRIGYNGYVPSRAKSNGISGAKVATKNFGNERRDD